jgi:hypothetical protein
MAGPVCKRLDQCAEEQQKAQRTEKQVSDCPELPLKFECMIGASDKPDRQLGTHVLFCSYPLDFSCNVEHATDAAE